MTIHTTDWVKHHAQTKADKLALVDLDGGRRFTYKEMHERVGRFAGFLESKGIKRGDRVAFLMLNSTDIFEVIFGCWRVGAVCLALNFRLTAPELGFILGNAEASLVVADKVFKPLADALDGKTPVKDWVFSDGVGGDSDYEQAIAGASPVYDMVEQSLEDQCMLMYSSGTTGTPKGVIITHGMMYFSAAAGVRDGGASPSNVTLNNMPLFHIGALNCTGSPAIWMGATAVTMRMFNPEATLDAINDPELGITSLFMVPAAYNAMRSHPKVETTDFSRIKTAICGGETVPTEVMKFWYERDVVIQEGYGMTETAAAGCLLDKGDIPEKVGSAGRALIHSTIRIVDDNGNTCAPNVPGEIWFKGASITPGYWRRPEANAESFVDGWFRSGDIARMDEEGFIYIEDRMKDMYISAGENVYPAEIENLIYQMPEIVEVAVIGVPDTKWGETGCAVAVIKQDCEVCLEDMTAHLDGKLGKYKWPGHIHFVTELPRNATGKVLKFELRESVTGLLKLR
jgi:fatty-acyl-CoA synthase